MPYVKVPEFKHGEICSSSDINDACNSIQTACDKLDGLNFKDESLGMAEVPRTVSLRDDEHGDRVKSEIYYSDDMGYGPGSGTLNPFIAPYDSPFPVSLHENFTWPFRNIISVENMRFGEKLLIRASLRIQIPDMAARTYYNGQPATVRVGLFRHEGDASEITDIGSMAPGIVNVTNIKQTEQRFRFAFTDKMPSASSLSLEAFVAAGSWYRDDVTTTDSDGTSTTTTYYYSLADDDHLGRNSSLASDWKRGLWYRDNRGPNDEDKNVSDSLDNHHPVTAGTLNYPSQFNYTVATVYEHGKVGIDTDLGSAVGGRTVSFVLLCWIDGFDPGMNEPPSEWGATAGEDKGCRAPFFIPVQFRDYTISMHPVRR